MHVCVYTYTTFPTHTCPKTHIHTYHVYTCIGKQRYEIYNYVNDLDEPSYTSCRITVFCMINVGEHFHT